MDTETLTCPECGYRFITGATLAHPDNRVVKCPSPECRKDWPLGSGRRQIATATPPRPPVSPPVANVIAPDANKPTALSRVANSLGNVSDKVSSLIDRVATGRTVSAELVNEDKPIPAVAPPPSPELARFCCDGQNAAIVMKLLERLKQICTSQETVEYMAMQERPIANFSPDAVVLTNRRFIIFRQKILGQMNFVDCPWLQVANVHLKEGVMTATITLTGNNGHTESVDWLPKVQARRIYGIAQEREEASVELRRQRKMEENRSSANQVVVQTAVHAPTAVPSPALSPEDPVAVLGNLKRLLDAGLISQAEFDSKKADVLSRL